MRRPAASTWNSCRGLIVCAALAHGLAAGAQGVPEAPGNLEVIGGDSFVVLLWETPDDGGSPILRYQRRHRALPDDFEEWVDLFGTGPDTTGIFVYPLPNGKTYEFEVRAVNANGFGASSSGQATTVDTEARVQHAAVAEDGRSLRLWFSQRLSTDAANVPTADRFEILVDGTEMGKTLDISSLGNGGVIFELDGIVYRGETVTIEYSGSELEDLDGTAVPTFGPRHVWNDSTRLRVIVGIDDVTVFERERQATLDIQANPAPERNVEIAFSTADGTAGSGVDYTSTSGTLTIHAGVASTALTVAVLDDRVIEEDETFTMTLSDVRPNDAAMLGKATATVTIVDDDTLPAVDLPDVDVSESAAAATFTLTLDSSFHRDITLRYSTREGTASADVDYAEAKGTVSIPVGETSATIDVSILPDVTDERNETFYLTLAYTDPTGRVRSVGRQATGTILDDDEIVSIPLFPTAADPVRQGFARVINHSGRAGEVAIQAIDDTGFHGRRVNLSIAANHTAHFNSTDLEAGNVDKGLSGQAGSGTGDWRLQFTSDLDIEVLAYVRTPEGFVTSMHDLAPQTGSEHRIAIFNPASNVDQVSMLRIVNTGVRPTDVSITGTDDSGASPGSTVTVSIARWSSETITARELETGRDGLEGALGDGVGKWRLVVVSDEPIVTMSLLANPTGHLTNLSTVPANEVDGVHTVSLLHSLSDPFGRQGFVRVINRSAEAGEATIKPFDDSVRDYDPLTLAIGANAAAHFNSDDLETGNTEKGLTGSTGAGTGHWWLELTSDLDIDVLFYVRTADGFLTSMHDLVVRDGSRHRVAFFNPASNPDQRSMLRILNPRDTDAAVTITGIDDSGRSPGGTVSLNVTAGNSMTLTSAELETGGEGFEGALGDGVGKWQLVVESAQPIRVMSLLESPMYQLTNLSTAPERQRLAIP